MKEGSFRESYLDIDSFYCAPSLVNSNLFLAGGDGLASGVSLAPMITPNYPTVLRKLGSRLINTTFVEKVPLTYVTIGLYDSADDSYIPKKLLTTNTFLMTTSGINYIYEPNIILKPNSVYWTAIVFNNAVNNIVVSVGTNCTILGTPNASTALTLGYNFSITADSATTYATGLPVFFTTQTPTQVSTNLRVVFYQLGEYYE